MSVLIISYVCLYVKNPRIRRLRSLSKMCDNDETCKCYKHSLATQSLDEMDFERGIWYAAQHGDIERVNKVLKEKGTTNATDSAGYTALHYAARNGHINVCQTLIENGAYVDAVTRGGVTALCRAATTGKEDIVDYLLAKNADPLIQDSDGKTALHRAAENKHFKICKKLLMIAPSLREVTDHRGFKVDCEKIDHILSK